MNELIQTDFGISALFTRWAAAYPYVLSPFSPFSLPCVSFFFPSLTLPPFFLFCTQSAFFLLVYMDEDWEEYDPSSGLTFVDHMLAGSMAGVMEHVAMFPVDTVKTHMQVDSALSVSGRASTRKLLQTVNRTTTNPPHKQLIPPLTL